MTAARLWGWDIGGLSGGSCALAEAPSLQGRGLQEEVSRLQTIRVYKQETNSLSTETLQRRVPELHKTKDEQLKDEQDEQLKT